MKVFQMIKSNHVVCKRCVMDTTVHDISFDHNGICNYCGDFDKKINFYRFSNEESVKRLSSLAEKIKNEGRGKEFDCILGLSWLASG